jgi:hypothetical protein
VSESNWIPKFFFSHKGETVAGGSQRSAVTDPGFIPPGCPVTFLSVASLFSLDKEGFKRNDLLPGRNSCVTEIV